MYSTEQLKRAIQSPHLIGRELGQLYHTRGQQYDYNPTGIDIFAEDWDNLILLDACRYDVFAERHDLPGVLKKRESRGATTCEFIRGNFTNADLHDTVYVSANQWYTRLKDDIEADVFKFIPAVADEENQEMGITPPEVVVEHATTAATDYPDKRLLIHFVQPHAPFIGTFGKERFGAYPETPLSTLGRTPEASPDAIRKAYRENLDLVLPYVEKLLPELDGRTVVSADHGELLGEQYAGVLRDYGHFEGIYKPELVEVPWLVTNPDADRKSITAGAPERDGAPDNVDSQLRSLGYL